ncbi:MAG: NAD-dependent epimerase/dehydratase family protein [Chthoniobacterales bacterium]|jgi:UDP-glucose 4-epimerase|nr:NAD-dependent epimerase/dehydratase family protein [Chthoniobacterales bacterium]
MKRIAVTGGRGRLAPGLARHLAGEGHSVQTFSRSAGQAHRAIAELLEPSALRDFDAVLHLGWSTVPLVSEENPGVEEREDLPLARALVAAAASCPVAPNIFFFSTAAVYGNTGKTPVMEDHECRPLGRYATAKLRAEEIFRGAPRHTVLRITNVFGAGCTRTRPQGIIPVLVEACRSGSSVTVWGDGNATKDYISVEDLHRAVDVLISSGASGVFNIASGHVLSVNELVGLISRAAGRPIRSTSAPHFSWDVEQAYVSPERLRHATGWGPAVDLESAIAAMVRI